MKDKIYFRNLNGFRFIAAMMVIVCHLELFKERIGQYNLWRHPLFFEAGGAGVDFFFVLSGFLITYLLLVEKDKHGRIDLKKFYMRRVLRIAPLYYLVVLLCFLLVPHLGVFTIPGYSDKLWESFPEKFSFSLLMMPNVSLAFFGEMPWCAPVWSVGVEEQFYLLWAVLIFTFKNHFKAIIGFIGIFISVKVILLLLGMQGMVNTESYEKLKNFIVGIRMECMGIGGLGAYLYYKKSRLTRWASKNLPAALAVSGTAATMLTVPHLYELHHIIFSVFFLVIILNGATYHLSFFALENKVFYSLGTISYGMYLWHPLCIGVSLWFMKTWGLWAYDWGNVVYYIISITLTIIIAHYSYYYFEKIFLRIKRQYTVVRSGEEARKKHEPQLEPA